MMRVKWTVRRALWLGMCLYCNYGVFIKGRIARRILLHVTGYSMSGNLGTTLYEAGLIVVAVMILGTLRRICDGKETAQNEGDSVPSPK